MSEEDEAKRSEDEKRAIGVVRCDRSFHKYLPSRN